MRWLGRLGAADAMMVGSVLLAVAGATPQRGSASQRRHVSADSFDPQAGNVAGNTTVAGTSLLARRNTAARLLAPSRACTSRTTLQILAGYALPCMCCSDACCAHTCWSARWTTRRHCRCGCAPADQVSDVLFAVGALQTDPTIGAAALLYVGLYPCVLAFQLWNTGAGPWAILRALMGVELLWRCVINRARAELLTTSCPRVGEGSCMYLGDNSIKSRVFCKRPEHAVGALV